MFNSIRARLGVTLSLGLVAYLVVFPLQSSAQGARVTQNNDEHSVPDAAGLFKEGKVALLNNNFAKAEADFRQVLILDPTSAAAHINLGVVYMRQKRWNDAITELNRAEVIAPQDPGILLNIGLAYYRQNQFKAAIDPLVKVLQQLPSSEQARYLLGLCYFFTGSYQSASETLAPLWSSQSDNLNYLYVLSIAASKASDDSLKEKAFNRMLEVGQGKPEFHLYVGKAWLAEDNLEKAISEFQAAAASTPNLPFVHYFLGRAYLQQHEYTKSQMEFEKDIALEPDFPFSYLDLGLLNIQLNQNVKAEIYFKQAIEHDSSTLDAYVGLAKLYRDTSRNREALDLLDQAVQLSPNSASVHYLRGQVLSRLGRTTAAREEFNHAASLLKSLNDRIQQDPAGDLAADAAAAAQQ